MRRFKDHILKDKKFLREVAIILIVGIIINVLCFLLCSITGHCSTLSDSDYFPFYSGSNPNNIYYNSEFINEQFANGAVFIKVYPDNRGRNRLWYAVLTDITYANATDSSVLLSEINNNMYQFSLFWYPSAPLTYNSKFYYEDLTSHSFTLSSTDNNSLAQFTSIDSTLYNNNILYFAKYSLEYNSFGSGQYVIVVPDDPINIGDFTDLPNIDEILDDLNNSYEQPSSLTGHALPSQPTENPNNTPFQDRLQMFDYLKDVLTALFGNLGYNISNWLNSLGSKIVQGFNSVSQNIWNGFSTLMSNIQGFFAPKLDYIIEKFNYITEEPDSEQIIDFIETTSVYSDISSINTSVTTFGSSFTGVSEPDDYILTFHIEDIDILNQSQPFILHLNILNPVKSTIRAFLWVIVSYGLFISVVDSLPNYINGGGGEDD